MSKIIRDDFPRLAAMLMTVVLCVALGGCGRTETEKRAGEMDEIVVAAAANLTDAFEALSKDFTAQTGVRVVYSFGATADLAKQIRNGAPFDVFASADERHVEELERANLLTEGTRSLYARGRLVLWTPPASRLHLTRLEDLAQPEVSKIAIAKPDIAPYGKAAIEALRALNLWEAIEPKVVYAQNVSQARQFAATGNADAAFLPRSLVKENDGQFVEVDERLHRPIDQAMAVVRASTKQDAARRFLQYVLSPAGQATLERYGYRPPSTVKP
ncbi:MAG TPA: molybdate ABC transporter substrate-binding protein [Pyrinomonadaceae bacterium]